MLLICLLKIGYFPGEGRNLKAIISRLEPVPDRLHRNPLSNHEFPV